ncbi:hypothetical protein EHI8A_065250 [Entamoeba histolytica HM-1:IMSS-B]|uniref:Uncharacterized protein n=6 Tax=Entamoeba histolytica TaxID=5759 RepID=C4M0X5_ENTH1|nr:hypothetical protein EHI_015370 [Entamoeba histolytica HM-1:IMSS]EMD47340.1 Hypothetical protein EHI5A_021940 [Entamoeba histolytica KU27]EMH75012.1 hypothetical protein EHI8A_065250 [Entamoeba histolytica HM-1:IMSS-B]EMS14419.1 hypothetical protein KM1_119410 [Entamoeba histolytica HM-3:IMSS]ENY60188.1 hypothetical protein EHI7A_061740 [Entamoeba histolytica HM-1:IMSS-A]GAT94829.1 hypothetical protein CL6EHI_015370 [Entamoeba histolytica]|eukprot:XP_654507.1 hypothetical protein EHI_015370 [Entamoeba histolytica HM-1:IMSS]
MTYFLIIGLLCITLALGQENDEYCDFDCFIEGLSFTVDLEGKMSTMGYNIPSLTFDGMTVNQIGGSTDNKDEPKSFNASITLHSLHAVGDILKESSNKKIGYMELKLSDASAGFSMGFDSYDYCGYNLISGTEPSITIDLNTKSAKIDLKCTDCGVLDTIVLGLGDFFISIVKNFLQKIVNNNIDKVNQMVKTSLDEVFLNINKNYTEKYINNTQPLNIPIEDGMMNITESIFFDMLSWTTTELLGGNSSLGLNQIIDRFTHNTGSIVAGGDDDTFKELTDEIISGLTFNGIEWPDVNGTIDFGLTYFNVSGLDTWYGLQFFEPLRDTPVSKESNESMCSIEPNCDQQLRIASGLKTLDIFMTFSINATANSSSISTNGKKIHEEADFHVIVTNNEMEGRIQIAIIDGQFENYTNNMCTNGTCWSALLDHHGTGVPIVLLNTSIDYIGITAASAYLEDGIQQIINSIADVFIYNYKPVIPAFLNGLINEFATVSINNMFNESLGVECDEDPDEILLGYKPSVVVLSTIVSIILSIILTIIAVIFLVVRWRQKKNNIKVEYELDGDNQYEESDDDSISDIHSDDEGVKKIKRYKKRIYKKKKKSLCKRIIQFPGWFFKQFFRTDPKGASMFLDNRITIVIRAIIPLIIFLNIALFITSNTGTGATVNAYIIFGSSNTITMPVQDFGLMNSVKDMWTAGVYPLSILIMVFSGIWPYTKLVMLLVVWMIPSSIIKPSVRGIILNVLDALGKWSFLDSYVMILMIMAFYFDVPLPIRHPNSVSDPMTIKLYVDPEYGFVTLLLGTLISLLLSHVMVGIHNKILSNPTDNIGEKATIKKPLLCFTRFFIVKLLMILLLCISCGLVIVGMFLQSFSFDFLGLAGWALDLLGYSQHRDFSVMDLGIGLPSACREPNSFAVRFTQVTYFITIVAIPLLHHIMLLILWVVPITRKIQNIIFQFCEILYAWSCIDVFIVSVIAAVVELSQFASFMVEPYCSAVMPSMNKSLDDIIALFFGNEKYITDHETCFEVKATLDDGCWCLFAGVIVYTVTTITIMKISKRALSKRLPTDQEKQEYWAEKSTKTPDTWPLLFSSN